MISRLTIRHRLARVVFGGFIFLSSSFCLVVLPASAANAPERSAKAMVVSANFQASQIGAAMMRRGGNAMDAAVATAFALAVIHPSAGNIGGGGFLVYQPAEGEAVAFDFREVAPTGSHSEMWLEDGEYSFQRHHYSHQSVGVPGTVAGLYLAWQAAGSLPWEQLLAPAVSLAEDGIVVTDGLARSLKTVLPRMQKHAASMRKFTRSGAPYEADDVLVQPDLAESLKRIAEHGPAGFYEGRTAELIVAEMQANGGLITLEDLAGYRALIRKPVIGSYRGYDVVSMPPPSSGGVALIEMLNVLESYDIAANGYGSASTLHLMTEAMRRAYADRARHLGDPDFNDLPLERLLSKGYAADLAASISDEQASVSSTDVSEWPSESPQTTHFSVVDEHRNAVSLTYTLEQSYGSGIVVPGGGFLLNNQMGDFNASPGLTTDKGLIGTEANLAEPGKRMLSSMSPTIISKDGGVFMVTGARGGRTIINTVLQTVLNVVDHGMNAQASVDAGRIHHQWLPDVLYFEPFSFSPDSTRLLDRRGHLMEERFLPGWAAVIVVHPESGGLEGGLDRRVPDGGVVGY